MASTPLEDLTMNIFFQFCDVASVQNLNQIFNSANPVPPPKVRLGWDSKPWKNKGGFRKSRVFIGFYRDKFFMVFAISAIYIYVFCQNATASGVSIFSTPCPKTMEKQRVLQGSENA